MTASPTVGPQLETGPPVCATCTVALVPNPDHVGAGHADWWQHPPIPGNMDGCLFGHTVAACRPHRVPA